MNLEEALQKISELEGSIDKLTADNTKLSSDKADMSKNFENARKLAETKEKELSEKLTTVETEYTTYKGSKETEDLSRRESFRDKMITEKARGDQALIEKIKFEYNNFNLPETNEDEIKTRVEKATAIHTKTAGGDANPAGNGSGTPEGKPNNSDLSANAQALHSFLTN
jgi:DNA repair exonuclease SbcCD ATPase subunit